MSDFMKIEGGVNDENELTSSNTTGDLKIDEGCYKVYINKFSNDNEKGLTRFQMKLKTEMPTCSHLCNKVILINKFHNARSEKAIEAFNRDWKNLITLNIINQSDIIVKDIKVDSEMQKKYKEFVEHEKKLIASNMAWQARGYAYIKPNFQYVNGVLRAFYNAWCRSNFSQQSEKIAEHYETIVDKMIANNAEIYIGSGQKETIKELGLTKEHFLNPGVEIECKRDDEEDMTAPISDTFDDGLESVPF